MNSRFLTFSLLISVAILIGVSYNRITSSNFWVSGQEYRLVQDDAMITLRVAENFWDSGSLTFNDDEFVAANTSLLWPVIISPAFMMEDDKAILLLQILSALLVLCIPCMLFVFSENNITNALSLILFSLLPSVWVYATSTWEHIPQMVLVTLSGLIFVNTNYQKGFFGRNDIKISASILIAALAFLIRPDTALFASIVSLYGIYYVYNKNSTVLTVSIFISICVPVFYLLFNFWYYGDVLPNTYYLKSTGGAASFVDGLSYFVKTIYDGGNSLYIFALLVLFLFTYDKWTNKESTLFVAIILTVCYVVYSGGDVFGGGRFFLFITPLTIYLIASKLGDIDLATGPQQLVYPILCIIISLPIFYSAATENSGAVIGSSINERVSARRAQVSLIPIIKENIPKERGSIGLFYLGAVSYYLDGYKVTDFLGKADPKIAKSKAKWGPVGHNKWNISYSMKNNDIAVIPFPKKHIEETTKNKNLKEYGNMAFWNALVLNDNVNENFSYINPNELGYSHGWGLYVRNDIVDEVDKWD